MDILFGAVPMLGLVAGFIWFLYRFDKGDRRWSEVLGSINERYRRLNGREIPWEEKKRLVRLSHDEFEKYTWRLLELEWHYNLAELYKEATGRIMSEKQHSEFDKMSSDEKVEYERALINATGRRT